jgi:hypothetical protein
MIPICVLILVTALEKIPAMSVSSQEYAFETVYFMSDAPPPLGTDPPHGPGILPQRQIR